MDPPFNSDEVYNQPRKKDEDKGSAQDIVFTDIWEWDAAAIQRVEKMKGAEGHSASKLMESLSILIPESKMLSYISYMAERLAVLKDFLKSTGSIYLHCDPYANYYLRLLMDAVFGQQNFRNEITWKRVASSQKGSQHLPKTWGNNTDTILYYAKSKEAKLRPFRPLTEEEVAAKFAKTDEHGRKYQAPSGTIFRALSMGLRPNLCYEWRGFRNPHPSGWRLSKERLEEEYQKGNIVIRKDGKLERRLYLEEYPGIKPGNLWADILPVLGKERQGYPTEKPLALLERIIRASSNEGDLVLDPFCGCGSSLEAAANLNRRFVGIDISLFAARGVARARLIKNGVPCAIEGIPKDLRQAEELAKRDKHKFEWWASESMIPGGIISNKKKGVDSGIDGRGATAQ